MTAGLFPAGIEPAGADPLTVNVNAPRPRQPKAIRYEGATASFPLDDLGNYQAVTPVEQAMVLSFCVRRGSLKSSPATGNTLHEITHLGSPDLYDDVRKRLLESNPARRLIADGSAAVDKIDVQSGDNGIRARVWFRDLTADRNKVLGPISATVK